MKKLCAIFFTICLLSSCAHTVDDSYSVSKVEESSSGAQNDIDISDEQKDTDTDEFPSELKEYDGNWRINKLVAEFFPSESDLPEPETGDGKYIGVLVNIDVKNGKVTFDDDDTYKFLSASELSSDELASGLLFAPRWGNAAKRMAREICGGTIIKEEGYVDRLSEGVPVKYIRFENSDHTLVTYIISFIIAANGDLLINIGECGGTYTLSSE